MRRQFLIHSTHCASTGFLIPAKCAPQQFAMLFSRWFLLLPCSNDLREHSTVVRNRMRNGCLVFDDYHQSETGVPGVLKTMRKFFGRHLSVACQISPKATSLRNATIQKQDCATHHICVCNQ